MAAPPSSSSNVTHMPDEGNKKSYISNYGSITDEEANVKYQDGQLSWISGRYYYIRDEDIITVTQVDAGYTVWSLAPVHPSIDSGTSQAPFELRTTPANNLPQIFLDKFLFQALPQQLDPRNNAVHILLSTLSGTGLSLTFFDYILQPILEAVGIKELDYNVTRTSSAESIMKFTRSVLLSEANEGKKQTVVMLSGDGGLVDIINGLLESGERSSIYNKPVLSQLPLGTGNALFHSLHKPSPLPSLYIQGLRTLLHGTPRPLPIFKATFSPGARLLSNEGRTATPLVRNALYGAVVASYGLHSTLVADSDTTEYRKHGSKRFGMAANDLLSSEGGPHAYKADVTLLKDNGEVQVDRKEHGYILASLVSNLEKPFTISPASKPLDGQLRIVSFGALDGTETMNVMKEAYNNGNHVNSDLVLYDSISGVRIQVREVGESWKWRRCCIDGLIVSVEEGGWMEVRTVEGGTEAVDIVIDP